MRMALGIMFLWAGAACLWVARTDLQADTPYGAYRTLINRLREDEDGEA